MGIQCPLVVTVRNYSKGYIERCALANLATVYQLGGADGCHKGVYNGEGSVDNLRV